LIPLGEIHVLQLGANDWSESYPLPENIDWNYCETLTNRPEKPYDIVFLDRIPQKNEYNYLDAAIKPYTLFVTAGIKVDLREFRDLYKKKGGQRLAEAERADFLMQELNCFFQKPYGEKFRMYNLAIAQNFAGSVRWKGNCSLTVAGDFGEEFSQIAYWRNNIPIQKKQILDFWLEYKKSAGVEIRLVVTQFRKGSIAEVQQKWEFSEEELRSVVQVDNGMEDGPLFVSLQAKGTGELQIIALHDRFSRKEHGYFLPGGERYVTSQREELFCYFDPGDMKPPLNVYFSGYKTQEGFEGYNMMKQLGCPFLLISESRIEGGGFYMGDHEYEQMVSNAIRKYMKKLGFTSDQVVLSGLSMGTFGALYYGCDIGPHAIVLGKPLASIGNVAANERLLRPGGFPTSLDVLMNLYGDTDAQAIQALNERFWKRFDEANWRWTKFVISYMIEDDYDMDAYEMLLSHLQTAGVQVYGKGLHGRHNDNTHGIVTWFVSQYRRIMKEDFARGEKTR
jgi:accessory secretory protein Asp2